MSTGRKIAILGLILGILTMGTQFIVTIGDQMADGETILGAIIYFFGLLTNISNIWIILIYAAIAFNWHTVIFRHANAKASAVALIILVAGFYHFILRPTFVPPEGLDFYLDTFKHYILPALYIVWWLIWVPHGQVTLKQLPLVALPALLYSSYVFARGAIINDYPYAVIDVVAVGYPAALRYAVIVVIGFTVLCILTILIDMIIARFQLASPKKTP